MENLRKRKREIEEKYIVIVKEEPDEHSDCKPDENSDSEPNEHSDYESDEHTFDLKPSTSELSQRLLVQVPSLSVNRIKETWGPSCSTSRMPFELNVAAESTSTIDIKEEPDEDENDSECENDILLNSETDVSSACKEDINNEIWNEDSSSMRSYPLSKRQSVLVSLPTDPYEIFRLIINDELLDLIMDATNESGKTKTHWKDVSREELLQFIGLVIHTGTIHMTRTSDYWKTHYLFNLTCFSTFMTRFRFMQILNNLSFTCGNTGKERHDRLSRIQPIIDHFNRTMASLYYPGGNLTVTETMTLYKGGLLLKESKGYDDKAEEKRLGIRIHFLSEPTGLTCKMHVTDGVIVKRKVVLDLLNDNLDCGHSVYLNEQYNSVALAATLLERKTYCTGPLTNRDSGVLSLLKTLNIANAQNVPSFKSYYRNGVHLCKVKNVIYQSTQHDHEIIHVPTNQRNITVKPKLVAMYHSVTEGDNQEEFMSYYPFRSNVLIWHKKLFIHMLHQASVNAYYFYLKTIPSKSTFYDFRINLLEKLLPKLVPPIVETHVLTKIENYKMRKRAAPGGTIFRKEVVRKGCKGCRLANKRTGTTFECRFCEGSPGYCIKCFYKMHQLTETGSL